MSYADKLLGTWQDLLPALGISPDFLTDNHGPCPICGGEDRFRFDDKGGRGTWFCNQCGAGAGIELVKLVFDIDFNEAKDRMEAVIKSKPGGLRKVEPPPRKDPMPLLKKISEGLQPVHRDGLVYRYLRGRYLKDIPEALKFHPSLRYYDRLSKRVTGSFPAMVAPITDETGGFVSYHVTYLLDGAPPIKANVNSPRKVMPGKKKTSGCTARLFYSKDGHIGLAEGIETAIAAHDIFGIPTWAALNTGLMQSFIPPETSLQRMAWRRS
jgi:putative DNA primase/helicase